MFETRWHITYRWYVIATFATVLIGCATADYKVDEYILDEEDITMGKGSFTYDEYFPLGNKPLNIWFYNPAEHPDEVTGLPVVILMHGNSRAAESYRDAMMPYAYEYGFLLIVPEFSKEYFPTSRDYHQGSVLSEDDEPVNEKYWAFSLIEPLFDYIKEDTNIRDNHYYLYGFSAGSQFAHRFMMHKPNNRAESIVAASAGTYSMPDFDIDYSYGLKSTVVTEDMLSDFFNRDVTVMVGDADTVRNRSDLVKSEAADSQGRDRVERGQNFVNQSKHMADSLDLHFNWEFKLIGGVGHSQSDMAGYAARQLFEDNN